MDALSIVASAVLDPSGERLLAIVADVLVKENSSPFPDDELSLPEVLVGVSSRSSLDMTTCFMPSDKPSFWRDPVRLLFRGESLPCSILDDSSSLMSHGGVIW